MLTLTLSWLYTYTNIPCENKLLIFILIVLALIYFSAFRDALGTDYWVYVYRIENEGLIKLPFLLSEPLFEILGEIIRTTSLSYVFYFFIMAVITVMFTLTAYKRYDNYFIIMAIYMLLPALYSATFNIIRQAFVAAIFLYASRFISENKSFLMYSFLIMLAFLMHKSAIFLLPLFFISAKDFNRITIIVLLVLSFLPGLFPEMFEGIMNKLLFLTDALDYTLYFDYTTDVVGGVSFTQVILYLALFLTFFFKKKILRLADSPKYIFAIKMLVLYLIFNNIASVTSFDIAYRIAFLFILFIPIVFAMIVTLFHRQTNRIIFGTAIVLIFCMISIVYFSTNIDNVAVIPTKFLSPDSLFD